MRIGLTGGGASVDKVVVQAERAEADGFSSLWYASVVTGDPLVAMAIAGRQTERIELGTAVLQTYPCHPLLQANRAASVVDAMGRPGLTLGIGPSHRPLVEGVYGYAYDHPGRSTEEYVRILTAVPSSIREVARPATAIGASGSPATTLAYQRALKPSASACFACSTSLSTVRAPPVSPIRMRPCSLLLRTRR